MFPSFSSFNRKILFLLPIAAFSSYLGFLFNLFHCKALVSSFNSFYILPHSDGSDDDSDDGS